MQMSKLRVYRKCKQIAIITNETPPHTRTPPLPGDTSMYPIRCASGQTNHGGIQIVGAEYIYTEYGDGSIEASLEILVLIE